MQKLQEDHWNANPPSVTTFLSYPNTPYDKASPETSYLSPACGFGWGFQFTRYHGYKTSRNNPNVQELTAQVDVVFQPRLCAGIKLKDVLIEVKAKFPVKGQDVPSVVKNQYLAVPLSRDRDVGTYHEPFQQAGQATFEITLAFHCQDHLSFPNTSPLNVDLSLLTSLDGFSTVDTKFYLYSAKVQGRPGRPRAVFAKASLLSNSNSYLRDQRDFEGGVSCDLEKDVPEVMSRLNGDLYDYDTDSDLESLPDEEPGPKASLIVHQGDEPDKLEDQGSESIAGPTPKMGIDDRFSRVQGRGKAFAINGTAHQTWKAFIFYAYTNKIRFSQLRSQRNQLRPVQDNDFHTIECSPKSMYRLADYAGVQTLKDVAKEGIRSQLSQENIVQELFSSFTSKYQELIEMEAEYLIQNMSSETAREFDSVLQLIILGVKPYCYRVLAFTIRRMRGEKAQLAFAALDGQGEYPDGALDEPSDEKLDGKPGGKPGEKPAENQTQEAGSDAQSPPPAGRPSASARRIVPLRRVR